MTCVHPKIRPLARYLNGELQNVKGQCSTCKEEVPFTEKEWKRAKRNISNTINKKEEPVNLFSHEVTDKDYKEVDELLRHSL